MAPESTGQGRDLKMDKKRLEYYKKKLTTRRDELLKTIARTEEEGRTADDDPTVDLADKAANGRKSHFSMTTGRSGIGISKASRT